MRGASKPIEVRISGAANVEEARRAAGTITVSAAPEVRCVWQRLQLGAVMMVVRLQLRRRFKSCDRGRAGRIGDVRPSGGGEPRSVDGDVLWLRRVWRLDGRPLVVCR